jgi:photosystem II stability/assembly factor-like uncharacterized protein
MDRSLSLKMVERAVSEDGGESWSRLAPGLDRRNLVIDNLAFDPLDPNTLYAATWELKSDKGWLFRTRDGGQTWQEISLKRFNSAIRAIAIAPSDPQRIALVAGFRSQRARYSLRRNLASGI